MAETHDTIKSLLAEFRGYSAFMPPSYHVTMSWHDFRKMLDRLEAAHNRETVTGSNQLREALVKARRFIDSSPLVSIVDDTGTIARGELCAEIDAALAAPPRNCDRFATVDEARKAHEAICEKYGKCHNGCPLNNEEHYNAFDCFEAWLFAPSTEAEGGAK